jgi:hypothetical protein
MSGLRGMRPGMTGSAVLGDRSTATGTRLTTSRAAARSLPRLLRAMGQTRRPLTPIRCPVPALAGSVGPAPARLPSFF